jgi:hypothetical protein
MIMLLKLRKPTNGLNLRKYERTWKPVCLLVA